MISQKLSTLMRLALVNSIGFAASTIIPLWVGEIADYFKAPAAFAATAQIFAAAALNFAAPWLFKNTPLIRLARRALIVAIIACVLQQSNNTTIFLGASVICGGALGVVLNCTNRLLAGSEHVQEGYSVYQLTEVICAVALFVAGANVIAFFGVTAVFYVVAVAALLGILALNNLTMDSISCNEPVAKAPLATRLPAGLALLALFIFFIGQSTINSYMLPIGQAKGFSTSLISGIVAVGMLFGFGGALSARLLGERFNTVAPIMASIIAMLICFSCITKFNHVWIFVMCAATLSFFTMFAVPYFFTFLAKLDRGGLYASEGPAFLLGGVALGPTVAVSIQKKLGLDALGYVASAILMLAGLFFILSARYGGERIWRTSIDKTINAEKLP